MSEQEKKKLSDTQEFDLDEILKEFAGEAAQPDPMAGDTVRMEVPEDIPEPDPMAGDTVRLDLPVQSPEGDTVALPQPDTSEEKTEPFGEQWQPQYEQPQTNWEQTF